MRIVVLLLLAVAAGLFGYSFGWERGQIAAKADSDRQLDLVQEQLARHDASFVQRSNNVATTMTRGDGSY